MSEIITNTNIFNGINSKYILQLIFNNLNLKIMLKIIQHNKNLQNRLDKGLNDFEDYSKIEIEILPEANKNVSFINIPYKMGDYYHIYFDNNKEEIKRTYFGHENKIQKIKIIIDYKKNFSLFGLFLDTKNIEKINFIKFNRKDIKNFGSLFSNCSSLKEINFSNFNTDNATIMMDMFYGCSSFTKLNLSNFNTKNVT